MSTPDPDWSVLKDLFGQALALAPKERAAFLDRACRTPDGEPDAGLRAAVEELLDADEAETGFLGDASSSEFMPLLGKAAGREDAAGRQIGPYRLLELVGEGGMGEVYRAERADGAFEQTVALKLVKRGMDTRAVLRRFEAERSILARLDHPGIARLLGGGATDEGRPWFAMEYVDGAPMTTVAPRLSLDARLAMFDQVCAAVQHAHARLVVHRDLKPSNILVVDRADESDASSTNRSGSTDAEPGVKLLDFGIAKLLDTTEGEETELTMTGIRPMTRAYAAPEQIQGGTVTTATDVYALGVVLYKVLTGERPFTGDTPSELEHAILETEPVRPSVTLRRLETTGQTTGDSTLASRKLQGDLDGICLKALRKEPEARYASVEALREDLRRYREGLPVTALRATVAYRIRRFMRRHRAAVLISALALAALAAGVVVDGLRVRAERDRAEAARDEAEATATFLEDVLGAADPFATQRQDTLRVADLLDVAAQTIDRELADQPARQGHLYTVIGRTYTQLGRHTEADSLLRLALTRLEGDPRHPDAASALVTLLVKGDSAENAEAVELARAALAERIERDGAEATETAHAHSDLAIALWFSGETDAAIVEGRRSVELFRTSRQDSVGLATATKTLGDILGDTEAEEAEALFRESVALRRDLYGSEHPALAIALNSLATHLRNSGDYEGAEPFAREALAISQAVLGPDHPNTVDQMVVIATLLRQAGDPERAIEIIQDAIERSERTQGPSNAQTIYFYGSLARAMIVAERYEEADAVLVRAIGMERGSNGRASVGVGNMIASRGSIALENGAPETARQRFGEALAEFEDAFGTPDNAFSAPIYVSYGKALDALGRTEEGGQYFERSLEAYETVYGPDNPRTIRAHERNAEREEALRTSQGT
ncbi:MAG: hypothetical protein Rubg2KO_30370 [Rubricoccaceae bacterium]